MLDFGRLRNQVDGQRGAFEGLVRHLAQVNPPATAAEFRHIHGAGGDGGIEAYWVCADGSEQGYQAKFHTKSGDIDWSALDRSIAAAISSHPKLLHIQVAIACDLTDVVPSRKGQSGRELWNKHRSKWEADAASLRRTITFSLWSASDIENLLAHSDARGLREYWFGEIALDESWFRAQFDRTTSSLEERYSPEDHVDVTMQRLFDGLKRSARWQEEIHKQLATLLDAWPLNKVKDISADLQLLFDRISEIINVLRSRGKDIELPPDVPFPTDEWLKLCADLRKTTSKCHAVLMEAYESKNKKDELERARQTEWKVRDSAYALEAFLKSPMHQADATRFAIFEGRAGAGKSHLLATEVARALDSGTPALMLLGTDFANALPIEQQIVARLEVNLTFDTFLGALGAAAENASTRALVVVDAINEGGGASRWRDELAAFATRVFAHPRLVLVVACRSEYAQYLLTKGARSRAVVAEVIGFVTSREQESAAQVYMDKRGILRPATPWLSPEFINPLFLRTTCLALERDGRNQYPTGLRGVRETLAFYLDATARHLGTVYDGSDDLAAPVKRAVVVLAQYMAGHRIDFVQRTDAMLLVDRVFEGFAAGDRSWLERLRLRGIIRFDPHPDSEADDPLLPPPDVVRFAFQRFQDHLVAESLLNATPPSPAHFGSEGALGFLIRKHGLAYQWAGVFQALWTITAETLGKELVDLLPGGADRWWNHYQVQEAFVESVFWRNPTAFTSQSLKLLNGLDKGAHEKLDILLKLSVLDHPWNAELLDRNLRSFKMPDRDAFWTVALNSLGTDDDEPSSPERLITWCLGPAIQRATPETLALGLLTLGWLFTTTNRALRDLATKAATEILLLRPELLPQFVLRFADIDDLYVTERVLAACAGACLRNPQPNLLSAAATVIYDQFFAARVPPCHLLARDYARCIVELAYDHGVIPDAIDLARCRPPYKAKPPRLPKSDAAIQKRVKQAGAETILSSCTGPFGDFGRYVIESRIRHWSDIRLTASPPTKPRSGKFVSDSKHKISVGGAQRWVVDRALRFGWNQGRFPRDSSAGDDRIGGSRIERIGKKYQWLAYFELLARLADNFWLVDNYGSKYSLSYNTPVDTDFVRNIDPTVRAPLGPSVEPAKIGPQSLTIETVAPSDQRRWVFAAGLAKDRLSLGLCDDVTPQGEWISLYRYASSRIQWPERARVLRHPLRQDDFHFIFMIAVSANERTTLIRRTRDREVDFHNWLPYEQTDAGYLYELGKRATWPDDLLRHQNEWPDDDFTFTELTVGYRWESHLDGSLPDGASFQLPKPWLVSALRLQADPRLPGRYLDSQGELVILASHDQRNASWCIARRKPLFDLLTAEGLVPLWAGIGERSGYPDPAQEIMMRIRWNGLMWVTKTGTRFETWDERHNMP